MADLKISALTAATTPLAGTEVLPIVQSGSTVKVSVANLTAGRQVTASELAVGVATPTAGYKTDLRGRSRIGGADGYLFDVQSNASNGSTLQLYIDNSEASVVQGGTAAVPVNFYVAGSKRVEFLTTGDAKLSTGNLVIGTSGKGIDFSATSGTGTSELLADYEEGTWTPTITAGSGSYTTVTSQAGTYTKVGRQVTLNWYFIVTNKGTGAGGVNISNLPFASNASVGNYYAGSGYDTSQGVGQTTTMTATTSIDAYKYDGTDPIVASRAQVGQITYFV
jgi:hypothetical protein